MKKYRIHFKGRQLNAIGLFYRIVETVEAENPKLAINKLYKKYDHITFVKIYEINKEESILVYHYGGGIL